MRDGVDLLLDLFIFGRNIVNATSMRSYIVNKISRRNGT